MSDREPGGGARANTRTEVVQRRERIVEVAMRHFAEHGYRDTHVEDVAREVGVAKGTVFVGFGSKEGLFLAAYQRAVSMLPAWLDAPREILDEGFWATLRWWFDRTEEYTVEDPVPNRVAMLGRYDTGFGLRRPINRFMRSEDPYGTLEFIGEDVIDHTPRDETVSIRLGSAFDVVGERRQLDFRADYEARWMEETIEIELRNHKTEPVEIWVHENLFRWTNNDVVEASHRYERLDARTLRFTVPVASDSESTVGPACTIAPGSRARVMTMPSEGLFSSVSERRSAEVFTAASACSTAALADSTPASAAFTAASAASTSSLRKPLSSWRKLASASFRRCSTSASKSHPFRK